MRLALRRRKRAGAPERGRVLPEVERDPLEARADPDDLAGRGQLVEPARAGSRGRAAGSTSLSQSATGQREPLQRNERLAKASRAGRSPARPGRKRPSAPWSTGSTSFRSAARLARRSRRRTSGSHHSRSDPAGAKLAAHEAELAQAAPPSARARARSGGGLAGREWPAPAREAPEDPAQRILPALEIGVGQAGGRHRAERVAVPARRPRRRSGARSPATRMRTARRSASSSRRERRVDLAGAQVTAAQQQVVQPVGARRRASQLLLHLLERAGSIRSRSSSWPSSSFSRSRSRASACARRSASGVSSSYMYVAT